MDRRDAEAKVERDAELSRLADIINKFIAQIEALEEEYGFEPVKKELMRLFPDLPAEAFDLKAKNESLIQEQELLQEWGSFVAGLVRGGARGVQLAGSALRAGRGFAGWIADKARRLAGRTPKAAKPGKGAGKGAGKAGGKGGKGGKGGLLGFLGGTAASAAGEYAMSQLDQHVHIDSVNPDTQPLNVHSRTMEELMKNTLEAIQNLAAAIEGTRKDLGGRLEAIDQNQDDLIGVQTGLSGEEVASRQGVTGDVGLKAIKGGGETDDKKIKDLEKRIKGDPKKRPPFEERPS